MKYARIDIETVGISCIEGACYLNFGDHLQNIIIKDLYSEMGISEDEIFLLNYNEITNYDGEYLVLPINQAFTRSLKRMLSPKIIPVFLGVSRDSSAVFKEEIEYFKLFSPIGCRDEALFDVLTENSVPCYFAGCLTISLDKRNACRQNGKVFLIEVPQFGLDAIPAELLNNSVSISNAAFDRLENITHGLTIEKTVRDRYELLKNEASLVVTSRLHVLSPCLAMGIPVILIKEELDYRFSWIDKYINLYCKNNINSIDWAPAPIDIEEVKEKIKNIAKMRIREAYNKNKEMIELTEYYSQRNKAKIEINQFSETVISFVRDNWNKENNYKFSVWGENDASERLINFIEENYPNAYYHRFYDSYKKIKYHDRTAQHPSEIVYDDDEFIFVTGYTATEAAVKLFNELEKPSAQYFVFNIGKVGTEEHND